MVSWLESQSYIIYILFKKTIGRKNYIDPLCTYLMYNLWHVLTCANATHANIEYADLKNADIACSIIESPLLLYSLGTPTSRPVQKMRAFKSENLSLFVICLFRKSAGLCFHTT